MLEAMETECTSFGTILLSYYLLAKTGKES